MVERPTDRQDFSVGTRSDGDLRLVLTGPHGRLRAACFCCAPEEDGDAAAFPFPPLIRGGQGG